MEEVEGAGRGVAYGKWEGEVVLGGIVKIKNRRKGSRRGNGASREKVVSKVWATQAGARRLGGDRGAHPRRKSPARA